MELKGVPHISTHVIVAPSLKGSTGIVSMLAVNLNQLIQDAASKIQVFVSQVISQEKENLLDAILVLIVSWNVPTISHKYVPALCLECQHQQDL